MVKRSFAPVAVRRRLADGSVAMTCAPTIGSPCVSSTVASMRRSAVVCASAGAASVAIHMTSPRRAEVFIINRLDYHSAWTRLMEVVRIDRDRRATAKRMKPLGFHRCHAVLILQDAVHEQERLLENRQPIAVEQIRTHDHVGNAGLVFEREKHKPLRGSGPLSRDDAASHTNTPPI